GRVYLDFGGGIAVCSLGHCHPRVTEVLQEQAATLVHCSNLYQHPAQAELARFLADRILNIPGKTFFSGSGAEANEAMIKFARKFGHERPGEAGPRTHIISCLNGFHGRTLGSLSATGQAKMRDGFAPLLSGFDHIPINDLRVLEQAVGPETVAIMLEPVQGEGGINATTPPFLRAAEALCRKHDLLLLLDEVQCGIGRCGSWNAWDRIMRDEPGDRILPDAVSWAKGLGGGFPVGATWFRRRPMSEADDRPLCDLLGPGSHGSTFGGTPLAMATALAVVETIADEDLIEMAETRGAAMISEVRSWDHPLIHEVRGLGLMIGVVLNEEELKQRSEVSQSGKPPSVFMVHALHEAGLLTVPARTNVVRFLPALNLSSAEADEGLALFKSVLDALI
ncbi:MAG: aminotransferase class III-fold pyridoxal phosphate-dependent enzyme, partial [Verrucomicrobiota bacterium]